MYNKTVHFLSYPRQTITDFTISDSLSKVNTVDKNKCLVNNLCTSLNKV